MICTLLHEFQSQICTKWSKKRANSVCTNLSMPADYRPPPNTDPLWYLSNYKRYQKIIYTRTFSNLMINMNKYFV